MPAAPVFNPLPTAVIVIASVIFGVEVMFNLAERGLLGGTGGIGWRQAAVRDWAFFGEALDWMLQNRRFPPELLARFVTYPLIHLGFTHMLFAVVFVLAMGKLVGETLGEAAVWILFFVPSMVGALVYGLALDAPFPLVGGYPGAYGLIGGYTFVLWLQLGMLKQRQIAAFRLIGLLMGVQLLFGLLFGGTADWVADVAGFATGFAVSGLLVPGGWGAIRARLRR